MCADPGEEHCGPDQHVCRLQRLRQIHLAKGHLEKSSRCTKPSAREPSHSIGECAQIQGSSSVVQNSMAAGRSQPRIHPNTSSWDKPAKPRATQERATQVHKLQSEVASIASVD
ncbi:hypothetical protein H920_00679 [Fukomys damarensis]|uniref:Uncharacterized protein n=1 Tax=Fukomys damarensis TaxID=885580 RepID=A0A091E0I9_FUKDA|nr:hypothetical protein H920_00679 [Fukomys damarensis]